MRLPNVVNHDIQPIPKLQVGWDEKVPDNLQNELIHWRSKLPWLENIKVNRCCKPERFGSIIRLIFLASLIQAKMVMGSAHTSESLTSLELYIVDC